MRYTTEELKIAFNDVAKREAPHVGRLTLWFWRKEFISQFKNREWDEDLRINVKYFIKQKNNSN